MALATGHKANFETLQEAFANGDVALALARKLHPSRFTAMSGKMAAIVAHIIGQRWTNPAIVELVATSDISISPTPATILSDSLKFWAMRTSTPRPVTRSGRANS
jgi:hypothetical protein